MTSDFHILADGFPPALIFGAVALLLWVMGTVVNSATKPNKMARPSAEANQLAAIRRRMLEEQARAKRAAGSRNQTKSKKRKQNAPPLPAPPIVQPVAIAQRPALATERADRATDELRVRRHTTTETARNVRLLLQRNAAAEAFVLTEIFGKPKALKDD